MKRCKETAIQMIKSSKRMIFKPSHEPGGRLNYVPLIGNNIIMWDSGFMISKPFLSLDLELPHQHQSQSPIWQTKSGTFAHDFSCLATSTGKFLSSQLFRFVS